MGCGCKKKQEQPVQPENQTIMEQPPIQNVEPTPQEVQDQVIQVAAALREMIENKEL